MFLSFFNHVAAVMQSDGYWAGPISLVVLFFASVIGPSFIVPAGSLLASIGVLIGADLLSWTLILWAAAGSALGSTVSYALGRLIGPGLAHVWPLKERPGLLIRAHTLFETHGFAAVLLAYFGGPLHAVVAVVAGAAEMRHASFQLANWVAAFVWTGCYLALGLLLESSVPWGHPALLLAPVIVPAAMIAMAWLFAAVRRRWVRAGSLGGRGPSPR